MPKIQGKQIADSTITQELLNLTTPTSGDTLSGATVDYVNQYVTSVSGETVIGEAEDGTYTDGIFTDFTPSTPVGTAVDRFNEMFLLLAPAPPESDWTNIFSGLNITSTEYNARALTTGSAVNNITDDATPSYALTTSIPTRGMVGDTGTFTMLGITGGTLDTVTLTTGDDTRTNIISLAEGDPYFGEEGKAGFYSGITSMSVTSTGLPTVTPSAVQLNISFTHPGGDTPETYDFYVNNAIAASVGAVTATVPAMTKYTSGVPSLNTGDSITNIAFTISNGVSYFYAETSVWDIPVATVNAQVGDPDAIPTTPGQTMGVTGASTTVRSGQYSNTSFSFGVRGKNAAGAFSGQSTFTSSTHRVDTVSNESSRLISGSGSYPATGYGGAYVSATSLTTLTDEMMMLNNVYQYPTGNYTAFGGSDYSSIANTRWVTFNLGNFSSNGAFTLNFIGSTGIVSIGQVNLLVEVIISGATAWVNGNANYSGVGNPGSGADGVASVVSGSSTPTSRRITFGAITYTGPIIVRVGITGSGPSFTGLTATSLV